MMDAATQKLVDEALRRSGSMGWADAQSYMAGVMWALEAAQRPPVSPEVREEIAAVLMSIYDHGTQPNALREADALLARFSFPSQPVYDEEKIARVLALVDDYDGCFERIDEWEALPDWEKQAHPDEEPMSDREDAEWWLRRARALVAALRGGELTVDGTSSDSENRSVK